MIQLRARPACWAPNGSLLVDGVHGSWNPRSRRRSERPNAYRGRNHAAHAGDPPRLAVSRAAQSRVRLHPRWFVARPSTVGATARSTPRGVALQRVARWVCQSHFHHHRHRQGAHHCQQRDQRRRKELQRHHNHGGRRGSPSRLHQLSRPAHCDLRMAAGDSRCPTRRPTARATPATSPRERSNSILASAALRVPSDCKVHRSPDLATGLAESATVDPGWRRCAARARSGLCWRMSGAGSER